MKKSNILIAVALILGSFSSCKKDKPDPIIIDGVKSKSISDKDGNHYESITLDIKSPSSSTTGVSFNQGVMLEGLQTGSNSNGTLKAETDPVTGQTVTNPETGTPMLSVGCYKDMAVNCDTLGALYSVKVALGFSSLTDLISANATKGDADGDGFDDESVKNALLAAGYDPNEYTISTLSDPKTGYLGNTVNDTIPVGGVMTKDGLVTGSTNKDLTYGLLTNGNKVDTIYTIGVGGKKLVPDMSKIDFAQTVKATKGVQGSCPKDWHIPSDGEWKILEMALGMSGVDVNKEDIENDRGSKDDLASKLAHKLHLQYSGYWSENGTFAQLGEVDAFWTSTAGVDNDGRQFVWIRYIDTMTHKGIIRKKQYDKSGFSVRCFHD